MLSATEKLKALVGGFFEDTEPSGHEAPVEVIRALPEIVAVVEAGDRYDEAWNGYGVGLHDQPTRIEDALRDLRVALDALDEALS